MKLGRSAVLMCLMMVPRWGYAQFPRSVTDPAAVTHGAQIYSSDCAKCHGDDARGTPSAPDLLRSTVVLHDRRENLRGKELGPYLRTMSPHQFEYTETQANELSQFLSAQVNKILRSGYDDRPKDLLSGDAKAGEAFFNGQGGCTKCHSTTGDLAGIGRKYSAAALQQRFLFPQAVLAKKAAVTATVKLPDGSVLTGDVIRIDDFAVTLRDPSGEIRSITRSSGVTVSTKDPYAGHIELLNRITDADIHNLTTYLDTLQ